MVESAGLSSKVDWDSFPVQGAKYLERLQSQLKQLPPLGVPGLEPHPLQTLGLREVAAAYLLAFFNPTLRSLRTLHDFSQTPKGQKNFPGKVLARSTFSELVTRLPSEPLHQLVAHLLKEAQRKNVALPSDLPQTLQHVLAVDGTFLNAAADMAWALSYAEKARAESSPAQDATSPRKRAGETRIRLDFSVRIDNWLPEVMAVHGLDASETENAQAHIQPGALHLYDRGIFSFPLIDAHDAVGASFVMRVRQGKRCPKFEAEQSRLLTEADRSAGVVSDQVGRMMGSSHRPGAKTRVREVLIQTPTGLLRLLTNRLDLEARLIALLYRYRWQVELFFRWLKTYAEWTHLMNHSQNGVELQMYAAVIGMLLIYLDGGSKPSKYSYVLFCQVLQGDATLEDILPILARRERECALARARRERLKQNPDTPRRHYGLSTPKH